jgi:hypothetical protein
MALSPEEMERLTKLVGSRTQTDFSSLPTLNNAVASATQQRLAEVGSSTGQAIRENITGTGQAAGQSSLRRGVQATAAGFTAVPRGALAIAPEPVREGVEAVGDVVSSGFKKLTDFIGSSPELQNFVMKNPEVSRALEEAAGTLSAGGEIASNILGARGVVKGTETAVNTTMSAGSATTKLVGNATNLVKNTVGSPEKPLPATVGEVIQGRPQDVAQGIKAFKEIDTEGVKTYAELETKIDESITRLAKVVDDELAADTTKTKLGDLTTTLKTKSGNTVQTNYVDTALTQMKELYEKTGDVQKAADIQELIDTAKTDGLTRLDVNNISRVYNTEFGTKAFNQVGDPLTSVNAQLYETIRKGLKGKARDGIGGEAAKAADESITALYNTKTLVTKNVAAVNRLQQKISERGLFEKAGYLVAKYADILSGGVVRGIVGGILPRGAGYKTMNALDLEARLQSNLEIIRRAENATTDADMAKILSELEVD